MAIVYITWRGMKHSEAFCTACGVHPSEFNLKKGTWTILMWCKTCAANAAYATSKK